MVLAVAGRPPVPTPSLPARPQGMAVQPVMQPWLQKSWNQSCCSCTLYLHGYAGSRATDGRPGRAGGRNAQVAGGRDSAADLVGLVARRAFGESPRRTRERATRSRLPTPRQTAVRAAS